MSSEDDVLFITMAGSSSVDEMVIFSMAGVPDDTDIISGSTRGWDNATSARN